MEHRFITANDNFINAIVFCKTRLIDCSIEEVMKELLANFESNGTFEKPQVPSELAKWIESNEISSAKLRNDC